MLRGEHLPGTEHVLLRLAGRPRDDLQLQPGVQRRQHWPEPDDPFDRERRSLQSQRLDDVPLAVRAVGLHQRLAHYDSPAAAFRNQQLLRPRNCRRPRRGDDRCRMVDRRSAQCNAVPRQLRRQRSHERSADCAPEPDQWPEPARDHQRELSRMRGASPCRRKRRAIRDLSARRRAGGVNLRVGG